MGSGGIIIINKDINKVETIKDALKHFGVI